MPTQFEKEKIISLHFTEGLGQTAISKKLNIPNGTIGHVLHVERQVRRKASLLTELASKETSPIINTVQLEGKEETEQAKENSKNERLRTRALAILSRNMKARTPLPIHQVDAANKILGRLAKPKASEESSEDWKSKYEGMKDNELGERLLTCSVTLLGLPVVKEVLDRLERLNQASIV